jgi:RecB family exonuclease
MDDELLAIPPVTAWSYSSLKQFEKCPYATYLQRVVREPTLPRDENHPLERGTRIHLEAEQFVRGDIDPLPPSLRKFEGDFNQIRQLYAEGLITLEEEWGFDLLWQPVGWTAPDVWARMKLDHYIIHDPQNATITDYKTGKSWGNEVPHTAQGQTYAIGAFQRFPELKLVSVEMWYLDEGKKSPNRSYTRDKADQLRHHLTQRALKLTTATHFPPKPSKYACQYCDYGNTKGTGACGFAAA